jgi:hypothetical protein
MCLDTALGRSSKWYSRCFVLVTLAKSWQTGDDAAPVSCAYQPLCADTRRTQTTHRSGRIHTLNSLDLITPAKRAAAHHSLRQCVAVLPIHHHRTSFRSAATFSCSEVKTVEVRTIAMMCMLIGVKMIRVRGSDLTIYDADSKAIILKVTKGCNSGLALLFKSIIISIPYIRSPLLAIFPSRLLELPISNT